MLNYNPEIGRFISPDILTILDETKGQINGLNLYMYCRDNPVNLYDPSGQFAISLLVGIGVSFAIGFISSTISQGLQYGWNNINYSQSAVDGLFAAVSTALAYTGIGWGISILLGGVMGAGQYVLDSRVFHDDFSWSGLIIATGIGLIGGFISGRGAQNAKALSKNNFDQKARTGIKALLTAAEKYGVDSANYAKVFNLWGNIVSKSINDAVAKNFTKSAIAIFISTFMSYAASYGLGKINFGF